MYMYMYIFVMPHYMNITHVTKYYKLCTDISGDGGAAGGHPKAIPPHD